MANDVKPMTLWIDTEFNDYKGALISMALVDESGREWYEVLECNYPSPWVLLNVMTKLNKAPVSIAAMQKSLREFLGQYSAVHIVADWPEDIQHFCAALITAPGMRIDTPLLTMEVRRDLKAVDSAIPHNALFDALALREAALSG